MTFSRRFGMPARIARFQNCYGPEGTWKGGREKAPATLYRKFGELADGDTIEVWGGGTAIRSYTYIDDMLDGIYRLMQSDLEGPGNIGCPQYVSVNELVETMLTWPASASPSITSRGRSVSGLETFLQRTHLLDGLLVGGEAGPGER